ncbi:MAG TPA: bacteriohemerythrin [Gammaproteobacteria bacterium]
MSYLVWTDNLNTGIDVIDTQHRQIIVYINQLHDAKLTHDRNEVGQVIGALIDYTVSHFGFEEALMQDAGYEFVRAHKKVHELFIKRIEELQQRFIMGEDIQDELQALLTRWLLNHIKHDDASYVTTVKPKVNIHTQQDAHVGWLSRTLSRFFRTPS